MKYLRNLVEIKIYTSLEIKKLYIFIITVGVWENYGKTLNLNQIFLIQLV